jgi:two-component system OmpR family sensor kinase
MGESPVPETRPVDLSAIVTDAVEDARALDRSRRITLTAADHAIIEADQKRIEQLIHNLLQNALVHTPAGTSVDVVVERSGTQTILRVRDQGPGLDADQASRVFDRFYRGTSSGPESGSGLGLFIVATVATSLGGHVSVDTAPGKGASFVVVLPGADTGPDGGLDGGVEGGPWTTPTGPDSAGESPSGAPDATHATPGNPANPAAPANPATPAGHPSVPGDGPPSAPTPAPDSVEAHESDAVHH